MAIAVEIPREIWNEIFFHIDPLVEGNYRDINVLGQQSNRNGMREKEDLFMRDLLSSSPSYLNATGGTNGDQPSNITRQSVDNIERILLDNNARTMLEMIEAENRLGTAGIRDAFIALANTAITASLQGVSGVLLKNAYADQSGLRPEEYCSISRFRFFVSSKGPQLANASMLGNTVYQVPMFGVEAIAKIEQNNYTSRVGFIPDWVMSTVAQNSGLYAKFAIAGAISNQQWLSGLNVTAAV